MRKDFYPERIEQIVSRFRKWQPIDAHDAMMYCGVTLRYVGGGCFRDVFEIVGFPLVVKFPTDSSDIDDNVYHACVEVRNIRCVMRSKSKAHIRQYMPKLYHFNRHTGVSLVHKYTPVKSYDETQKADELISRAFNDDQWDSHKENFGIDSQGQIILLDLGVIGEEKPSDEQTASQ